MRLPVSVLRRGRRFRLSLIAVSPVAVPMVFLITAVYMANFVLQMDWVPTADSTADWLTAMAARDGHSPYVGVETLAAFYGVRYESVAPTMIGDGAWIHPRMPGALLLLQPLTYLSPESAYAAIVIGSIGLLGLSAVFLFPKVTGTDHRPWLLLSCLFVFTAAFLRTLQFGSLSFLIAVLIWALWYLTRAEGQDSILAGIALGIAGTLKLYPLFLLWPAVLARKWRAVLAAVGSFAAINLLAIVLFKLSILDAWHTITAAGEFWIVLPSNASLVPRITGLLGSGSLRSTGWALVIAVAGGGLVWRSYRRSRSFDLALALSTILMLLASPLSWLANDVLLFLPVVMALAWRHGILRYIAAGWVLVSIGPAYRVIESGVIGMFGRISLLIGLVLAADLRVGETETPLTDASYGVTREELGGAIALGDVAVAND